MSDTNVLKGLQISAVCRFRSYVPLLTLPFLGIAQYTCQNVNMIGDPHFLFHSSIENQLLQF